MKAMSLRVLLAVALVLAFGASTTSAQLVDLGPGSFTPLASAIDFSEVPLYTVNPTYNFAGLPGLGNVNVSFGGWFMGQTATGGFPVTLSDNTPTGGVYPTLDPGSNSVTVTDAAPGATSPVLSGSPTFNGPIAVRFSTPVAAVGLKGGYFDALNSTTIEAYASDGSVLGSITNSQTGFEFYGLADASGNNVIAGISFYITGPEPAGFEIDNLTFGAREALIPEPASLMLLGIGGLFAGLAGLKRRKKA